MPHKFTTDSSPQPIISSETSRISRKSRKSEIFPGSPESLVCSFVCFEKGVLLMATVPLALGARMLGIHPKTLHSWLTQANLSLLTHPTDARIKCVAEEHLLEVARRHNRPLLDLPSSSGSRE